MRPGSEDEKEVEAPDASKSYRDRYFYQVGPSWYSRFEVTGNVGVRCGCICGNPVPDLT